MGEFRMPSLGAEMTEGRLVEWLVSPGDTVHRGDIIAVVETDKAALEVEIWEDGRVAEFLVEEGVKVPVGTPLARLTDVGAPVEAEPAEAGSADVVEASEELAPAEELQVEVPVEERTPEPATVGQEAPSVPTSEPVGVGAPATPARPVVRGPLARHRAAELGVDLTRVRGSAPGGIITRHDVEAAARDQAARPAAWVSPYARRLAAERGVDLKRLSGTGPGGAIVARDLESAPTAQPPSPERREGEAATVGPGTEAPAAAREDATVPRPPAEVMRAAIGRAMSRSKREIPHYYLGTHVDLTDTLAWLDERNAGRAPNDRLLPAALELKASALALAEHPDFNGYWIDEAFVPGDSIELGVAIALRGGGLLAPAIHAADTIDLDELMRQLRDLVRRARKGRLRSSEATSATCTVTNLGDLGVETVYGVIYPPQVAIVGFGRIVERPWAVGGLLGVRSVVHLTLAADHRQTDGHLGGRFLETVADLLRRPEDL